MPAAPRAVSVSRSEPRCGVEQGQVAVSAPQTASTRALTQSSDYTRVLNAPACARTAHFAAYHLPQRPLAQKKAISAPSVADLSTAQSVELTRVVDESPLIGLWLGLVVPKRHAKRAVTRTLLKRHIRVAVATAAPALGPGLWVVRLRTPFARSEFASAASARLASAASAELAMLMATAATRSAR